MGIVYSGWQGGGRARITTYNISRIGRGVGYFAFGTSVIINGDLVTIILA